MIFGVKSWFSTRNTSKIFTPPSAIEKNMIFWHKMVIFHTKYPQNTPSARRYFFKCAPPNLKSWIRPWQNYFEKVYYNEENKIYHIHIYCGLFGWAVCVTTYDRFQMTKSSVDHTTFCLFNWLNRDYSFYSKGLSKLSNKVYLQETYCITIIIMTDCH